MSLEIIKNFTNNVLVNFFQTLLKHDDHLKQWHGREITVDTMTVIMSEIKQESMRLQQLKNPSVSLVFSVVALDQPYRVFQDIADAASIDVCMKTLIDYHRSYAQAHPTPTTLYQYQQIMETLVKGVLNDIVKQNLVSDEWKEKITTHLATQKIATTRNGATYRFGFLRNTSTPATADNTVPATTNRF